MKGGTAMFAALEAKLRAYWHDLTGEARADLEKALEEVKAEEAKLAPLLTTFEADVKAAVAVAEPELKSAVEALLGKLLADAGSVLGGAAPGT
jgi:hypothetical protein